MWNKGGKEKREKRFLMFFIVLHGFSIEIPHEMKSIPSEEDKKREEKEEGSQLSLFPSPST
jgi:hypothetical protein